MKNLIKKWMKDTSLEPAIRWVVKRSRGIPIPFDNVKNEIYDRQAHEIIRLVLSKDSCCVDVGCHHGDYLRLFVKYAPQGRHLGIEPIPELANTLRSAFPGIQIEQVALGGESGEVAFQVATQDPALSGLQARTFIRNAGPFKEIRVNVRRMDDLVATRTRVDLIKIDVEGAEGPALEGAIATIRDSRPFVLFEHGARSSEMFGYTSAQIFDLLCRRCGLAISLPMHWLQGKAPLGESQFVHSKDWYFLAHAPERTVKNYPR